MKSSFWVLCGITLLCFGSVRCSRYFTDYDENSLDKTRDVRRTSEEGDTERELYKARNNWNELTNELYKLQNADDTGRDVNGGSGEKDGKENDGNDGNNDKDTGGDDDEGTGGDNGGDNEDKNDKVGEEDCKTQKLKCVETGGSCIKKGDETIECNCPESRDYVDKIGCKADEQQCKKDMLNCVETGGFCVKEDGTENRCICPKNSEFVSEKGCKVDDEQCKTDKPQCVETGGYCIKNGDKNDCECPANSVFVDGIGCKIDAEQCKTDMPKCVETGGFCIKKDGTKTECECPAKNGFVTGIGCKADEEQCKTDKPMCVETGGFCIKKDGENNDCVCPTNTAFVAGTGCRVPADVCEKNHPECTKTGGTCSIDDDGETIKCNCKAGIIYDSTTACNVSDEMCDQKYDQCKSTGGSCVVDADGTTIKCKCKAGVTYDATTGCNVNDTLCNEKQPKCKETNGKCVVDKNVIKCNCSKGFEYNKNSGCSEDKCIAKCGVPYNKPSGTVRCTGGPFGNVDCKCINKTLEFDPRDKECKITYCKKVCGGNARVKCNGDIFDEDKVECGCNDVNYDFKKEDDKKVCKLNYCKKTCGTDKGVMCEEDNYTPRTMKDCLCTESGHEYNGKTCQTACSDDDECENGGECKPKGNAKFCECKRGTEGDTCSVVRDCQAGGKYEKCKDGKGECSYDVTGTTAICTCSGDQQLYKAKGYCDVKCKDDSECGEKQVCNSDKFCVCKAGYEGNDCETVTGCKTLKEKCDKIKKECIFAEKAPGMATCDCGDGYGYDRKANECRIPCSKEKKCEGNRVCNADNFCICKGGYEGDECKLVTGCKKLNEKCKEIGTECIFDDTASDKATCKCKEGFTYDAKENKCKSSFCYPKNPCPSTANCTADESTGVGYCHCPENQYHNHITNKCQEFPNKCLLRKTTCDKNFECNKKTGKCECKEPVKEGEECKPKLCKPNRCVTGADCSETDGSCHCKDGKYFTGKSCKDVCNLKDYKRNCTCPADTERKEGSEECVHKKDEAKCDTDCGYGICLKKGKTEYCRCFSFARNAGGKGKCTLMKTYCASQKSEGELQDGAMKCKCEGLYKQADDGITCVFKTCDDDDVKKECAAKGGECKMDWKKGYDCVCPTGYEKDENANNKCTDPCSIEDYIKKCAKQDKFCYNSYTITGEMTSTCGCPPTAKEVLDVDGIKRCSGKAEYSYLIKNILVLKKQYVLKSGINKLLLNSHLISSLRQTYKKDIFDYGYLYDYKVQDDVVNCSVWINFKSAPSKTELDKIKVAGKKFSKMCEECDEAVVWPPSLLLSDQGLTAAVPETLEFCKPEVKDRVCGKGASCVVKDKETGTGICFCDEGYKLIEYSLKFVGNSEVARCEDVDECADGTHTCSGNTVCRNTFGNYSCVCKDGFKKKVPPSDPETDKSDCVDMCTDSPCKKGKCVLKGNSFDCQCQAGAAGSLCDREDENYKSAKKSTVVVGAVLGTILAVGAIAVIYYIVKRKKRSGSEDFRPTARMDHAEMTERRHMRGVTNKAYE